MKNKLILSLCAAALLPVVSLGLAEEPGADFLGKPLPDFTVETIDGGTFTLSEALKEKDMVLINLWASWCGPCESEFPYLQEAYEQYRDRAEVIALSVEPTDTAEVLTGYAREHGMTFPVGNEGDTGLSEMLNAIYIPTTVVVDRFGNVALAESGAQPSTDAFAALFDFFTGADYTQTRVLDSFPKPRAAVAAADEAALSQALGLPASNPEDPSFYPFLPGEAEGRQCLTSSNAGRDETAAQVTVSVAAAEGDALAFEARVSSENVFDALSVTVNGSTLKRFSGETGWFSYAVPLAEGENQVIFAYGKDSMDASGEDTASLCGLCLLTGEAAREALAALPAYDFAEATDLTLVNETAREIVFEEKAEGALEAFFGMPASVYILNAPAAELSAAIGPESHPDDILLYDLMTGSYWEADQLSGTTVTIPVPGDSPFGAALLMDNYFGYNYKMIVFCADEAGADALEEMMMGYDVTSGYTYADGGERAAVAEPGAEEAPAAPAEEAAAEAPLTEATWRVLFLDQNGAPVPGCIINFCSDQACSPAVSDETGTAVFTGAPYPYHLQVLRVPAGYTFDTSLEYTAEENGGSLTLQVTKE